LSISAYLTADDHGGLVHEPIFITKTYKTPKSDCVQRVQITCFKRDVAVKMHRSLKSRAGGGDRGDIIHFSRESRKRLMLSCRNNTVDFKYFMTLTYPAIYPTNGKEVKNHLSVMRKWLVRRGVAGMWWLEFQKRGAPHIHLAYNNIQLDKNQVSKQWYQIVKSGDEKHLRAGTRIEMWRSTHGAEAYMAKEGAKLLQKQVPEGFENVGRFWSNFGGAKRVIRYIIADTLDTCAQAKRTLARAYKANRRRLRETVRTKIWRDTGIVGFIAWDCAPVALRI